jgi:thymidylate kinase
VKIIEVVGMAGTGKSTLSKGLLSSVDHNYGVFRLDKSQYLLTVINSFFYNIPVFIENILNKKHDRSAIKHLLHYKAAIKNLIDLDGTSNDVLILDQGPIFLYVSMCLFELNSNVGSRIREQYKCDLFEFSNILDGVIYLDAPVDQLHKRVVERGSEHQILNITEGKAASFLNEYSSSYEETLAEICADNKCRILTIDTYANNVDDVHKIALDFVNGL